MGMGGHSMASGGMRRLQTRTKREGGEDTAETKKKAPVLPACSSRGEAGTVTLAVPRPCLPDPPHLGEQKWILRLWWVFFFIILYKNKSTFRNLFLLSLALALSRSIFFLSFRLFIEVGCNL